MAKGTKVAKGAGLSEEEILERIRQRAYELSERRREDATEGDPIGDWLAAEAEVRRSLREER